MAKVIIFVTMSLWDEPHRGRHHYANLLSQHHTIVWINRNLMPGENEVKPGIQHIKDGLYVLHTGKPFLSKRLDDRLNLNNWHRLKLLQRELKLLGMGSPNVVWCYDFKGLPFVEEYKNQATSIYFCNDWFGEWTSRFGKWAFPMHEKRIASTADYVITISPKLCLRFTPFNKNVFFVPHGLWLPDKPTAFGKKRRPEIAGYIGTLNDTIDINFLWKIVEATDLNLLLAGPIIEASPPQIEAFHRLIGYRRVQYLGNLGRSDSDDARSQCDVLLLPYSNSRVREYGFPIKYFEYLGSGKPIISTDYMEWPAPFRGTVNLYRNEDDLQSLVSQVYRQWNDDTFRSAVELAGNSTWGHRVETISELIGVAL